VIIDVFSVCGFVCNLSPSIVNTYSINTPIFVLHIFKLFDKFLANIYTYIYSKTSIRRNHLRPYNISVLKGFPFYRSSVLSRFYCIYLHTEYYIVLDFPENRCHLKCTCFTRLCAYIMVMCIKYPIKL